MKRFFLIFSLFVLSLTTFAQLVENGYYRLKNRYTERYARLRDGYGRVDLVSIDADMEALQTVRPFDNSLFDPASIIDIVAIPNEGGYELRCQGVSLHDVIGYYVRINKNGDFYQAYAERSGFQIYLSDKANVSKNESNVVKFMPTSMKPEQREWSIIPVSNDDGRYLGVKPTIACTENGKYYTSYYTSFPYSLISEGMKVFYVSGIDVLNGITIYREYTYTDIAKGTPVFIECSSSDFTQNRLDVHCSYIDRPTDNILTGVYFKRFIKEDQTNPHNFFVRNDTSTMRVLGLKADGKLGYVKGTEEFMPENSSYLPVPKNSPAEFTLMTQDEYDFYMEEKNKARVLTYYVDGDFYASDTLRWGDVVVPRPTPSKEGYFFTGWVGLPSTMPAEDVNVYGVFSPNYYTLNYYVDAELYKSDTLTFGEEIIPEPEPAEREGYTFSGWSTIPATMPSSNVTVYGIFNVNYYNLTYFVDGEQYKQYSVAYSDSIIPEPAPVKQGYAFSGWSEIPPVMPAQDVTVNGTFTVGLQTATGEVESVRYFSLIGQELEKPVEGVLIVKTKYKDGREVLNKVLYRR